MKFLLALATYLLTTSILPAQDLEWVFKIVPQENYPNAIDVDADDNVYIAGSFKSAASDFDPGTPYVNWPPHGDHDGYLAKYTPDRQYEWSFILGDDGNDEITTIHVLGNTIYTLGKYQYNPDLDPGPDTAQVSGGIATEVFVAKYTTDGDYISSFVLVDGINARDMAIDDSGNILLCGNFGGTVDFDPSANDEILISQNGDCFLAKYDSNGNFLWVKVIESQTTYTLSKIVFDDNDNIFYAGEFASLIDLDPSAGVSNFTALGSTDCFLAKYDSNGNYEWGTSFEGGVVGDYSTLEAIDVGSNGNICVTGTFEGDYVFDPIGAPGTALNSFGSSSPDIYLLSYTTDGVLNWCYNYGQVNEEFAFALKVGPEDAIWIGGSYDSSFDPVDMNPGVGVNNMPVMSNDKCFIAKYSETGEYIYAHAIYTGTGQGEISTIKALAVSDAGSLYIHGFLQEDADFDVGLGDSIVVVAGGFPNLFLAKYHESLVGVDEQVEHQSFLAYPNPTSDNVVLEFATHSEGEIDLYDLTGQLVKSYKISAQKQQLSVSGIAPGVYLLHYLSGEQLHVQRLVIR
jgi:hypothetical protein